MTELHARVAVQRPTAATLSLLGARPRDVRRGMTAPAQFRLLARETAVRAR